jgi:hypothetical protein
MVVSQARLVRSIVSVYVSGTSISVTLREREPHHVRHLIPLEQIPPLQAL